jgi:hypothetical protein
MDDDYPTTTVDIWDFVTGYQPADSRPISSITEIIHIPPPEIDAWGNSGDDSMESILLLLDASKACQ